MIQIRTSYVEDSQLEESFYIISQYLNFNKKITENVFYSWVTTKETKIYRDYRYNLMMSLFPFDDLLEGPVITGTNQITYPVQSNIYYRPYIFKPGDYLGCILLKDKYYLDWNSFSSKIISFIKSLCPTIEVHNFPMAGGSFSIKRCSYIYLINGNQRMEFRYFPDLNSCYICQNSGEEFLGNTISIVDYIVNLFLNSLKNPILIGPQTATLANIENFSDIDECKKSTSNIWEIYMGDSIPNEKKHLTRDICSLLRNLNIFSVIISHNSELVTFSHPDFVLIRSNWSFDDQIRIAQVCLDNKIGLLSTLYSQKDEDKNKEDIDKVLKLKEAFPNMCIFIRSESEDPIKKILLFKESLEDMKGVYFQDIPLCIAKKFNINTVTHSANFLNEILENNSLRKASTQEILKGLCKSSLCRDCGMSSSCYGFLRDSYRFLSINLDNKIGEYFYSPIIDEIQLIQNFQ